MYYRRRYHERAKLLLQLERSGLFIVDPKAAKLTRAETANCKLKMKIANYREETSMTSDELHHRSIDSQDKKRTSRKAARIFNLNFAIFNLMMH